ncbi:MAG: GNAT family N-acetyltransferase [Thermosynechococcaceae cyanobacterium]
MKRKIIPMSFAECEVLERPFGWKVEYWDGQAHLTPREVGITTRIDLVPRSLRTHHELIPVHPAYTEQMIAGYLEVFTDSVEFCDWPSAQIQDSAEKCIAHYFAGKRGEALSASVIALEPNSQNLAGLALFILKREKQPHLDLLYVRHSFQRRGIATAMVTWGINGLSKPNFSALFSTYHICNEESRLWHHHFGFQDIYDPYVLRLKSSWLTQEIWRKEKLGLFEGLDALITERDHCQSQLKPEDRY